MTILRRISIVGNVGSYAHGLQLPNSDRWDTFGICARPPADRIPLFPNHSREFEWFTVPEFPTAFLSLADYIHQITLTGIRNYGEGNPSLRELLFTPELLTPDLIGLRANRHLFLSKEIAATFTPGWRTAVAAERDDLALRFLMQTVELLTTGTITMPMQAGPDRDYLMAIRRNVIPTEYVDESIQHWERRLQDAVHTSLLPDQPDHDAINLWRRRAMQ
ncbi:nucleotidyltransferase domain-containing protein [Mycolicibacterium brisbanense]|uniref:Uncharacterized protein n=1 Tax=Mycolicibacterium brisbanense TaxID=146020 RepID=A0A117I5R1_9MYCO|nr:nucleotidyltransferase domain-containing protein [Mycolicibacterium brisbanense]MCV7156135.1 nucleotidyltransferase domain-containing protein [Mycolicibacterium brisbanense]GAS88892.1 putative uncharacterized protein [Mycolicibacterium brisbanense]